ncbi:MAG: hypothetical protein P8075_12520 [Deltaproteobacteria bacterium]
MIRIALGITWANADRLLESEHTPERRIVLIRFIRSDRKLGIFTERFEVQRNLVYCYVKAEIGTSLHSLELFLGDELIASFDYEVPSGDHGF